MTKAELEVRYEMATKATHDKIQCGLSCATCMFRIVPDDNTESWPDNYVDYCSQTKRMVG